MYEPGSESFKPSFDYGSEKHLLYCFIKASVRAEVILIAVKNVNVHGMSKIKLEDSGQTDSIGNEDLFCFKADEMKIEGSPTISHIIHKQDQVWFECCKPTKGTEPVVKIEQHSMDIVKSEPGEHSIFSNVTEETKFVVNPLRELEKPALKPDDIVAIANAIRILGFLVSENSATVFPSETDDGKRSRLYDDLHPLSHLNFKVVEVLERQLTDEIDKIKQKTPVEPWDLNFVKRTSKHPPPTPKRSHSYPEKDAPPPKKKAADDQRKLTSYLRVPLRPAEAQEMIEWKKSHEGPPSSLWGWHVRNQRATMDSALAKRILGRVELDGRREGLNLDDTRGPREYVTRLIPIAFD
ncbi:hypothetical protein HDU67_002444 [Dinochytrium kinnereticum]|nr:hypothetical protein HDU67_002444 [Dinochytrium kinnereticum]